MKKILFLTLSLFLLVGCSNTNKNNNLNNNQNNNLNNTQNTNINEELKEPTLEWCQLYNPNGFDTITCVVSNPNTVDIDITYDLVYYKDGKEVARSESFSNFDVSPKHNDVIWANVDIPKSIDVDEVKMENIIVTKAYHNSIGAEINYVETIGNQAYFSVKHNETPTIDTVTIFLYNDKNGNKKCDKGELVITDVRSILEKETKISVDTNVVDSVHGVNYNAYEIYYNAY